MYTRMTVVSIVASLVLGAACAQANVSNISLGISDFGQGATFTGAKSTGGSLALNAPSPFSQWIWQITHGGVAANPVNSSDQFLVSSGSSSSAGQLFGYFTANSWTYGGIQGSASSTETAKLAPNSSTFYIGTAGGNLWSGTVESATITSTALGGGKVEDTLTFILADTAASHTGNTGLDTLVNSGNSSKTLELTLNWFGTAALSQLSGSSTTLGLNGSISAPSVSPVPEPTTVAAGAAALGLLFFMRVRAKRQ